ncbi:restriction endonuclease subunit S [Halomonas sp. 141]|jgi:type I restriction enzyme S subunit|uniref:restriction endonuclease subunit S n=1 Tax=Halomonas sp. 141 TaxID=2056666 RepID=UPI000C2A536F|nr:restriction endonuclease subunit S [Halomonas sp. 141]PJX15218.1 restriction endonuclease subunit S [Halomonas sp. 141]
MSIAAYPKYESYKDTSIKWSPEIPQHWGIMPLKFMARMKSGDTITAEQFTSDGFPVYGGNGFRGFTDRKTHTGKFVLIGRQGALCGNVNYAHDDFFATEHAIVVSPKRPIETIWLGEAIRCAGFNQLSQSAAQPGISTEVIGNQRFPFPPLPEQRAIAAFLDNKCAKIDQAVRIKEAQIKLLRERRQILIQQAVTRGLNPDAPMKDSGIDWIGKIPAHWKVWRSKFLFKQSKELARKNDIQLSATQSFGVISQEKFESLVGRRVVKISTNLDKRKHVELNDFVISMRSFQGGLERAYSTGCIRSSYVILRPAPEVNPDFFGYLLKTPRYIHALQITGNFIRDGQDLTFENFADVDLYVPPYQEQAEIADHIKHSCDRIDDAIKIKQNQIAKLKEYKTTLINAAVTGKIKVS